MEVWRDRHAALIATHEAGAHISMSESKRALSRLAMAILRNTELSIAALSVVYMIFILADM